MKRRLNLAKLLLLAFRMADSILRDRNLDPVTHLLTGACFARAGLNRKTGLATLTMVLATEAPDLDVVANFWGGVTGLQHHRGFTHSLVGAPFVAAFTVACVYGIYKLRRSRGKVPIMAPRWTLLFAFAWLGTLVHLFQDFTNSYGVRPFAPFNPRWYSWDIVPIVDPFMLLALLLALVIPALSGLISEEVGEQKGRFRGSGAAIFALVVLAVLIFARSVEHRRALVALNSITYSGENPVRGSAFATLWNPFSWNAVVETQGFFELLPVNSRAGELDPHNLSVIRYKPEETPVTLAAKKSRLGRVYLDWAQYPLVQATRLSEGNRYLVTFSDLRFSNAEAQRRRRSPPLSGYVVLDPQLRVEDEGLGPPPE